MRGAPRLPQRGATFPRENGASRTSASRDRMESSPRNSGVARGTWLAHDPRDDLHGALRAGSLEVRADIPHRRRIQTKVAEGQRVTAARGSRDALCARRIPAYAHTRPYLDMHSGRFARHPDSANGHGAEMLPGGASGGRARACPGSPSVPGGTPRDDFSGIVSRPAEEFYNEYDVSDPSTTDPEPGCFSYGEHVESRGEIDYAPFGERAEDRARFHHDLLDGGDAPSRILRRQWWAVPDHLVVVVVVYFEANPNMSYCRKLLRRGWQECLARVPAPRSRSYFARIGSGRTDNLPVATSAPMVSLRE